MKNTIKLFSLIMILPFLTSCWPPNTIVDREEGVDNAWANVESSYQRRVDLIDNLVNTVKGAANFEKETFLGITKARAGIVEPTQEMLADETKLAEFYKNHQALQAEARTMFNISVENYPTLRATDAFRDFQAQLEGTENRINVERNRYNSSVKEYNAYIQKIPGKWFSSGKEKRSYFKADPGSSKAPVVEF